MVYAFDTLSYSRHLRHHGVPAEQADARAEAARQFIMGELVTKQDLTAALETQTLRLSVRLGLMIAAAITLLGVILKIH